MDADPIIVAWLKTKTTISKPTEAAIASALRSTWITFTALLAGFLAGATAAGAIESPTALFAYTKVAWFPFLVSNVVGPALHARGAYQVAVANPGATPPVH